VGRGESQSPKELLEFLRDESVRCLKEEKYTPQDVRKLREAVEELDAVGQALVG